MDASTGGATGRGGAGYLEHLTPTDLALLADLAGDATGARLDAARLRGRPDLVADLLARQRVFDAVYTAPAADPLLHASPFLVFALAVHRAAGELAARTYLPDWSNPRTPIPIFDVDQLREFLADPTRRFFLAELLASYVCVVSGSVTVRGRHGWRRRRFNDLDPERLALLLDVVPAAEHPGIYRRLGDAALFLTGVFPDHVASAAFGPVRVERLLRAARVPEPGGTAGGVALLAYLGRAWYRLAAGTAPVPTVALRSVADVAERFDQARRILNLVTNRYLLPFRTQWWADPHR